MRAEQLPHPLVLSLSKHLHDIRGSSGLRQAQAERTLGLGN